MLHEVHVEDTTFDTLLIEYTSLKYSGFRSIQVDEGAFRFVDVEAASFISVVFNNFDFTGGYLLWTSELTNSAKDPEQRSRVLHRFLNAVGRDNYRETHLDTVTFNRVRMRSLDFTMSTFQAPTFEATVISSSLFEDTRFLNHDAVASNWDVQIDQSYFKRTDFSDLTPEQMRQIVFIDCIFEDVTFPEGFKLQEGAGVVLQ